MRLEARPRFDPRARYDVTDDRGGKIGEIQKVFGESVVRTRARVSSRGRGRAAAPARGPTRAAGR